MTTKPNIKLFMAVCDAIVKHREQFSMARFDCGATACIAGWALRLSGECFGKINSDGRTTSSTDACSFLGIHKWQGNFLFYGLEIETPEEAVKFIHNKLDEWYPGWRDELRKETL